MAENVKVVQTDEVSVGGYKMIITSTPTGYYRIDAEGPGQKPAICHELFTSLPAARQGLNRYLAENEATLNKQAIIERVAGPKPARKDVKSKV